MELAVCVQHENRGVTIFETIDAIKKAGFKNVFVQYYHRQDLDYDELDVIDYCKKQGLNIAFAHLGYKHINDIWLDNEDGENVANGYMKDLEVMKSKGIDNVMMHLSTHKEAPMYNEIGLERFKRIVAKAKELGIRFAFENTRQKGYLEYVLGAIKDETVGLCMDAGHIHTHFNDEFNYEFFKGRYYMVHLHDNHGDGLDEHLLPFDGTVDWEKVIRILKENNFAGPLTLELCYRDDFYNYMKDSVEDFYKEGYKRGQRLLEIWEKV